MTSSLARRAGRAAFVCVAGIACRAAGGDVETAAPPPAAAIARVTVVDTVGGRLVPDQTVVWAGGRITAVGDAAATAVPAAARVIDGTGKYLLPGLWDMHAHVLWPGNDGFFPLFVVNGVTGVRDMGTHFPGPVVARWREDVARGARPGPRFVWAGPVIDGPRPAWPGSTAVASADDARRAVRDRKAAGVDFVKVYEFLGRDAYLAAVDEARKVGIPVAGHVPRAVSAAEASDAGQRCIEHLSRELDDCMAGEGARLAPIPDPDPAATAAVRAALAAAFAGTPDLARFGPRSAANLRSPDGRAWAAEVGGRGALRSFDLLKREGGPPAPTTCLYRATFDRGVEHFRLAVLPDRRVEFVDDPLAFDPAAAAALAARMRRNGTWQCPTLAIDWTVGRPDDPAVAGRPELRYLPDAVVRRVRLPFPPPPPDVARRVLRDKAALLRALRAAGVPMLAGTDCPMASVVPGFSLHDELRLMVEAGGFTPLEAIRAATLAPARFLERDREMGSVAVGRVSDLVLLDADPLADVRNTRRIAAVVAAGRLYDRPAVDWLLASVATAAAANRLDERTADELLREVTPPAASGPARKGPAREREPGR